MNDSQTDAPTPVAAADNTKAGPARRPRNAASLLLLRDGEDGRGPEVLMGRRAKRSRFMPDVYVFPGGAVDAGDARARPATPLPDDSAVQMAVGNRAGRARALAMAAVRETFEETGLVVGAAGDPGSVDDGWAAFAGTGMAPALAGLHYIGRAITPSFMPIRFHARFFMAQASDAHGEPTDTSELFDLQWVPLSPPDTLRLADVTRFILTHVAGLLSAPADAEVGKAFFTYRNRGRLIQFHGGPPPPAWNREAFEVAAGAAVPPRPR